MQGLWIVTLQPQTEQTASDGYKDFELVPWSLKKHTVNTKQFNSSTVSVSNVFLASWAVQKHNACIVVRTMQDWGKCLYLKASQWCRSLAPAAEFSWHEAPSIMNEWKQQWPQASWSQPCLSFPFICFTLPLLFQSLLPQNSMVPKGLKAHLITTAKIFFVIIWLTSSWLIRFDLQFSCSKPLYLKMVYTCV